MQHSSFAAVPGAAAEESGVANTSSFYADWPYVTPRDILPYLRATAVEGDVDSVLSAIDSFAAFYPMYRCGPEKGAILEELVVSQQPAVALELGTFMAYGAARIARRLPPGGRLVSVEASEEQAEVAREVLRFAGLPVGEGPGARIQVINGLSGQVLPTLRQVAGLAPGQPAAFVFLDHCKPCYLPDLLAMEELGLVAPGTLVLADNVLVPGTPDYLRHVGGTFGSSSNGNGDTAGSEGAASVVQVGSGGSSGGPGGGGDEAGQVLYRTELRYTRFEVEERYKKDWQPKQDAMSVSLRL